MPGSRGGASDPSNIRIVDKEQHSAFHTLFDNLTLGEIARRLKRIFPHFDFILLPREKDGKPKKVRKRKCWVEEKPRFGKKRFFTAWAILFREEAGQTDIRRAVAIINWWSDPKHQIVVAHAFTAKVSAKQHGTPVQELRYAA